MTDDPLLRVGAAHCVAIFPDVKVMIGVWYSDPIVKRGGGSSTADSSRTL